MFLFGTSFLHFETYLLKLEKIRGIPGHASGKEPVCQCRRCRVTGLIPELERSPGRGHHNPLQYSCLGNPMDRGAWWATVHGVTKSWTQLKQLSPHHRKYKKKKREREREKIRSFSGVLSHNTFCLFPGLHIWNGAQWILNYQLHGRSPNRAIGFGKFENEGVIFWQVFQFPRSLGWFFITAPSG